MRKCDFCGIEAPTWRERAGDATLPKPPWDNDLSVGDWLSCQACHDLIAQGAREQLAAHSAARVQQQFDIRGLIQVGMLTDDEVTHLAALAQEHGFWASRTGESEPLEREPA